MNHIIEATLKEEDLLLQLGTSKGGLLGEEAKKRIVTTKTSNGFAVRKFFHILFRQIKSPLVLLLFFAAGLSYALADRVDAFVIFGILTLNTLISFVQEYHSERILERLEKYIPRIVSVRRDGNILHIDADHLVCGDIVLVNAGDLVPADIRLLAVEGLMADEGTLTGESAPVSKGSGLFQNQKSDEGTPRNCIFAGTKITGGEGEGVVFALGKKTLFGSIGQKAGGVERKSLFEENISAFSRTLLYIVLISAVLIFGLSFVIKDGSVDVVTLSLFVFALAIGILPEALPVVTTVTLSHGAMRLAKKSVVVKRLSAVEDFGNIDVLCTDKTGTITENSMSVQSVFPEEQSEQVLEFAFLAREGDRDSLDSTNPFDSAIKARLSNSVVSRAMHIKSIQDIPFDAVRRISSCVVVHHTEYLLISRGAPEEILKRCTYGVKEGIAVALGDKERHEVLDQVREWGMRGLRVFGIATKKVGEHTHFTSDDEQGLTFSGLIGFEDPLKASTKDALMLAGRLGLDIKILTGDHPNVARAIAMQAGLIAPEDEIFIGEDIQSLSDDELAKSLLIVKVFARVSPDDKFRIIKLLETMGKKVAYMGDGVNDVPSLAQAHVAIAVPSATPAAKEISDIVLLKKDLHVIVNGLLEGRKIFENITKYLKYSLGGNLGNFASLAIISLYSPLLPQLPTQILLGNFISDLPLLAIGWDSIDVEELKRPQHYDMAHIRNYALMFAPVSSVFDFLFFGIFGGLSVTLMRTLWFIESMLTEIFLIFSVRSTKSVFAHPLPSTILVVFSVLAIIITLVFPYIELGSFFHFVAPNFYTLMSVLGLCVAYGITNELLKLVLRIAKRKEV